MSVYGPNVFRTCLPETPNEQSPVYLYVERVPVAQSELSLRAICACREHAPCRIGLSKPPIAANSGWIYDEG